MIFCVSYDTTLIVKQNINDNSQSYFIWHSRLLVTINTITYSKQKKNVCVVFPLLHQWEGTIFHKIPDNILYFC